MGEQLQEALVNEQGKSLQVSWYYDADGDHRVTVTSGKARMDHGRGSSLLHREKLPTVISVGSFEPKHPRRFSSIEVVADVNALTEKVRQKLLPLVIDERSRAKADGILQRGITFMMTGQKPRGWK